MTIRLFGVLLAMAVFSQMSAAAVPCESLASTLSLPYTTITSAQTVAAGAFNPAAAGRGGAPGAQAAAYRNLLAFCRVTATVKPTSDSDIKMEVWMPVTGWNGNFEGHGSGGMGGAIPLANMAKTLRAGFATGGSDTGHTGNSAYALDHPEKVIDFGYRAGHEMTVKAKAVVAAYYGSGPKLSFMDGCGGSAAMAQGEMQRFPTDYDGIAVTGFSQKTRHALWQHWAWEVTHKDAASDLPPEKLQILHNGAINACDALDGVKDGLIENPMVCKFDPKVVECRPGENGSACLTTPQVEAARKIYAGPTNPRTGEPIFFPAVPGSELPWSQFTGAQPFGLSVDFLKYFVFKDPNWDPKARPFDYDRDLALVETLQNMVVNASNPNILEFVNRGGKLLLYEGWGDGTIPPGVAIDYYNKVVAAIGAQRAKDSVRLFMVPGLAHCQSSDDFTGSWHTTMVSELDKWINTKKAPDQIITSRLMDGKVVRTRPLCAYPQLATYKGTGSTDDAANFRCKAP